MLNADSQPSYPAPIEVLLVDDHHHVRRLLREVIETYKDLSIVGEAVNGEEAVLLAAKLKPAAVVMDIHLPVLSGVAAATLIKIHNPFVSIIALTAGDPNEVNNRWASLELQPSSTRATSCTRYIPPSSMPSNKSRPRSSGTIFSLIFLAISLSLHP